MFDVERLHPGEAAAMWRRYASAIGIEQLRASYGSNWPRAEAPGETVWSFNIHPIPGSRAPVAWLSLRKDPTAPWIWLATGVWPAWQKRGVAAAVRTFACGWAFGFPDITGIAMEVLDTNPSWQAALRRQIEEGTVPWRPAGRIEIPDAEACVFWWPRPK